MDFYTPENGPYWQLQEAKAMFSKVVRSASEGPQIITVHGKESAVVLSMDDYRKLTAHDENLVSFMEKSPWADQETELPPRQKDTIRSYDL